MSLTDDLKRLEEFRGANPGLKELSDSQLTDLIHKQTGELPFLKDSSALGRGVATVSNALSDVGQSLESAIVGDKESASFGRRVVGRAASNLTQSAPEIAANFAAAKILPRSPLAAGLIAAGNVGAAGARSYVETGDVKKAAASSAGAGLSMLGSIAGAGKARSIAERAGIGPRGQAIAGAAGGYLGSMPGDALDIAVSQGASFFDDPVNVPAYLLSQAPFAAVDYVSEKGQAAKVNRENAVAKIPTLDEVSQPSTEERLLQLKKKPVASLSEVEIAEMTKLQNDLRRSDEIKARNLQVQSAQTTKQELSPNVFESPATVAEQLTLVRRGKKPVAFFEKGTTFPTVDTWKQNYAEYERPEGTYVYNPDKVTPKAIDDAIASDSLGQLLGYGSPSAPKVSDGRMLVLRTRKGLERLAADLGDGNEQTVRAAFEKMKNPTDFLSVEPIASVMATRKQNQQLLRDYSLEFNDDSKSVLAKYKDYFGLSLPEGQWPVEIQRADGTIYPAVVNGYWDYPGRGHVPSVGSRTETGWTHGVLGSDERVLTKIPGPSSYRRRDFSLVARPVDEFLANSLIDKLERSLTPTQKKGARFQRNQQGMVSSKGLIDALRTWAPKEMLEHYESAGLSTLSKLDKVRPEDVARFVQENTPKVEVKKLVPYSVVNERAKIQHQIESAGYTLDEDMSGEIFVRDRNQVSVDYNDLDWDVQELLDRYETAGASNAGTDAATGRYGVEPIRVEEMDRPSDILVRESSAAQTFTGLHFGDSDKNVLASIRGYFPSPDKFFAFEVQSDWGQQVRKEQQMVKEYPSSGPKHATTQKSPLLASYETLALKTAIKHALENGATKLVIPDAPTVTMIEGHDQYTQPPGRGISPSGIKQYAGMVQHYEKNLPAILKRLTGDSGRPVDLGRFTSREPSLYFDGKHNITGREYDLTKLSPEVDKLFSVYGMGEQYDFATSLRNAETELEAALLTGKTVTNEQFVNAIFSGVNVDKAIALNYLKNATGSTDAIQAYSLRNQTGPDIAGFTEGKRVGVNVAKDPVKAFRTAAHELSHVATNELKSLNPAAYNDLVSFFNDQLSPETRQSMFNQLAIASGLTDVDTAYQAGLRFDKNDPLYRDRTMKEGVAMLSEVLAHEAYKADARINPTVARWLSFLPPGVQSAISRIGRKVVEFFGPQYPSMRHFLGDEDAAKLAKAFDKVVQFTRSNEAAQNQAYKLLKRMDLLDEASFFNRLEDRTDSSQWKAAVSGLSSAPDEIKDFSINFLKDSRLVTKTRDIYEDFFFSPLFRAKIKPFTMDAFREGHHFRDKIKSVLNSYMEFLGQDGAKSRSRDQALAEQQKWIDRLSSDKLLNDRFNRVLSANLEKRQKLIESGKQVQAADLVSAEEMVSKFGLKKDEAEYLSKLVEVPKMIAEQTLRQMTAVDNVNLAKMFFIQNRKQDINQVKAKAAELTRIGGDAGASLFQKRFYEEAVARYSKDPAAREQLIKAQNEVSRLDFQVNQAKMLFEARARELFGADVPFTPELGKDFFINSLSELALKQGEVRAEQQFITKDEGYFPLVRRGRYLLRVFNEGPEGTVVPTTKEYKGFKTMSELNDYVKSKKLRAESYEITDKEELKTRASLYTPKQVQLLRDKARLDLQATVDRVARSRNFANEQIKNAVLSNLQDVVNSYRPLESELKEIISVKGDKFRERRWLVPGFEEADFIPNIYEYMDYKTTSGQKALTRAEVELQLLREEIQSDPNLLTRMRQELEYTLGHTTEWSAARKWIFYSYLGASIKNAFQNFLQVPLNALPEAVSRGAGLHAYTDMLKAYAMSAKWMREGSLGDAQFDVLMKQAEADGSVIPSLVDAYAPSGNDIQTALDAINKRNSGFSQLGAKANKTASDFMVGFDKFMRSTSVGSEAVNRRVSFIMSLLDSKRKGVKDPKTMYNIARDFTDFSNFVGDKANRPGYQVKLGGTWAHGPLLAATALQTFMLNHISQLYAYNKKAQSGDKNAARARNLGLAHLMVFAGVLGLPLASTLEQLAEDETGFSFRNWARKNLGDVRELFGVSEEASGRFADAVLTGLPTALGLDTGGSVGLGDPMLQYRAGEDITALDLLGPGGSLVQRSGETLSEVAKGNWNTAARKLPVKAWNHLLRIYDAVVDGDYKSQKGMPLVENLNTGASVAVSLGFTPRQASIQREMQSTVRKGVERQTKEYQEAGTKIARLLEAGDMLGAQDVMAKYLEDNAGTVDTTDLVDSISSQRQKFRQVTDQPPSARTQGIYDAAREVFPEAKSHYAQRLPELFEQLETARLLGQTDVLTKKLSTLDRAAQVRALYDSLIQAGFSPAQASALSSGNTENLLKTLAPEARP